MLKRNDAAIALTDREAEKLQACEAIIARGLETFIEVGTALLAIRDQRLYRDTHSTFEAYCRERWQMSRPNAYELMGAAATAKTLMSGTPDIPAPTAVSQMRPLASLQPQEQRSAWSQAVVESHGKQPTAAKVQEVVRAHVRGRAKNVRERPKRKSHTARVVSLASPLYEVDLAERLKASHAGGVSRLEFAINLLQEIFKDIADTQRDGDDRQAKHNFKPTQLNWNPDHINKGMLIDVIRINTECHHRILAKQELLLKKLNSSERASPADLLLDRNGEGKSAETLTRNLREYISERRTEINARPPRKYNRDREKLELLDDVEKQLGLTMPGSAV